MAFAVFGERGFEATTLKEIASGAGISSGSVYTYFPDKETLFRETVNRGWASFIEEVEIISRGGLSRDERVAVLLDRGFSFLGSALPLIRGMLFEAVSKTWSNRMSTGCAWLSANCLSRTGAAPSARPDASVSQRLLLTRILILGLMSSAALLPAIPPATAIDSLKEAIRTLMSATGILLREAKP